MKTTLPPEQWLERFNEHQYDLLLECTQSGDIKKWNAYRKKERLTPVLLEGADLTGANLSQADLRRARLIGANLSSTNMTKTILMAAELADAKLDGSTMNSTDLISAKLCRARLTSVAGDKVKFRFADLSSVAFHEAQFEKTSFDRTNLTGATFRSTIVRDCELTHTDLRGAKFEDAQLQGSRFCASIVDGETLIWGCGVDRETDFTGIGLASARIEPQLLTLLETNIRRIWWRQWYRTRLRPIRLTRDNGKLRPVATLAAGLRALPTLAMMAVVRAFWWSTDYGSSTIRLLSVFFGSTILFAAAFATFPFLTNDRILSANPELALRIVRSLYFSMVTTTTVGYGDISANPNGIAGHCVLIVQVALGYTLLAALVVRMGILFNSMPAAGIQKRDAEPKANAFTKE